MEKDPRPDSPIPPAKRGPGRPPGVPPKPRQPAETAEDLPDEPDVRPHGLRLRPQHQDEIRAKIQAAHLVRRLQLNALGELEKEMTAGQIKSAEVLLSKSLSTLSATEVLSVNANDRMSESEILGKIAGLLQSDPRLLQLVGSGRLDGLGRGAPLTIDQCVICGGGGLGGGCPSCGTVAP